MAFIGGTYLYACSSSAQFWSDQASLFHGSLWTQEQLERCSTPHRFWPWCQSSSLLFGISSTSSSFTRKTCSMLVWEIFHQTYTLNKRRRTSSSPCLLSLSSWFASSDISSASLPLIQRICMAQKR